MLSNYALYSFVMLCINLCFLNKHTGSISSFANLIIPRFPTGHGILAVIMYVLYV